MLKIEDRTIVPLNAYGQDVPLLLWLPVFQDTNRKSVQKIFVFFNPDTCISFRSGVFCCEERIGKNSENPEKSEKLGTCFWNWKLFLFQAFWSFLCVSSLSRVCRTESLSETSCFSHFSGWKKIYRSQRHYIFFFFLHWLLWKTIKKKRKPLQASRALVRVSSLKGSDSICNFGSRLKKKPSQSLKLIHFWWVRLCVTLATFQDKTVFFPL